MTDAHRDSVIQLRFAYHWTPQMIAHHVRIPQDQVEWAIYEHQAGIAAATHARQLRRMPLEDLRRTHVPAGFSHNLQQPDSA